MRVLRNIGALATCRDEGGQGDIHVIEHAAIVWQDDTILWAGLEEELPLVHETAESEDCRGWLVVPGLVDCHTHLAFGGWRAGEFERRLRGESYLDIAQSGGGIAATVRATRAASEEELVSRARMSLAEMRQLGVTTVECKSGYGLDEASERKLLHVYRRLRHEQPTRLVVTFLGAHVVPPEYRDRRDEYVRWLVDEMIPAVAALGQPFACDCGNHLVDQPAHVLVAAVPVLRRHHVSTEKRDLSLIHI